jgi:NitT/TauT family transport system substrate-binding protein
MFSDQFARDRARAVSFMKGYVKASRHYFDAVLTGKTGAAYDEVVAITAKYTGATPDLIRKGFPYQDRDGRLMPGDVARQLAWWHAQKLVKTPMAEKDIVDETFLRDALRGLK